MKHHEGLIGFVIAFGHWYLSLFQGITISGLVSSAIYGGIGALGAWLFNIIKDKLLKK